MTRMWMVDPNLMCQQHRLGEHKEIHDLVGFIKAGRINKVIFHASRAQVFPTHIVLRHAELEHYDGFDSPIKVPGVAAGLGMATLNDRVVEHNASELARRCEDCRERQT